MVENGVNVIECGWDGNIFLIVVFLLGFKDLFFVIYLFENGVDLSVKNVYGIIVLYLVVEMGCLEIVKVLIENGVYVNFVDVDGLIFLDRVCCRC